jgi:hypothetical protein
VRPRNRRRASARANGIARRTERTADSAACFSVKRTAAQSAGPSGDVTSARTNTAASGPRTSAAATTAAPSPGAIARALRAIRPAPRPGRPRPRGGDEEGGVGHVERVEALGQARLGGDGRIHPVRRRDGGLEGIGQHEGEEVARQFRLVGGGERARDLDLHVVALREGSGGLGGIVLGDQVVGGGGRVGQHHVRLAFEEEPVGLGPALGHGDDVVRQVRPDRRRLVAVGRLHPEEEAEARRRGARVLDQDRDVAVGEVPEGAGRVREARRVVDEGEPAPVEGKEHGSSHRTGRSRVGGSIPCGAKRPVAVAAAIRFVSRPRTTSASVRALEAERARSAAPSPAGTNCRSQPQVFEGGLHRGAGAPFGHEAVVGVDGEDRSLGRERAWLPEVLPQG